MVSKGKEWRTKPYVLAECMDCGWKCEEVNGHGISAKHARKHNHTVRVEVTKVYIYEHGSSYGS